MRRKGFIRRRPHHPFVVTTPAWPSIVFLTVCTKNRKSILATSQAHAVLIEAWTRADAWLVGRYVLMPDHVHLFCVPGDGELPLAPWVHYWKSHSSQRWPEPAARPVWQTDFWETQLRRGESYDAKWEYVRANPVRAGLLVHPEAWPYAGELNTLSWP